MANSSTHSNVVYSNNIFKQYLMTLANNIVWKDTSRANNNESEDINELYQSELFVVANRGLLNFSVVKAFPRSVLRNTSVTDTDVELFASDKSKIPTYMRDEITKEYEKALTSINPVSGRPEYFNKIDGKYEVIYDEPNNYYRMLMGLPNRGDTDYVYNTDSRWATNVPIHKMSKVDRIEMERAGVLDTLIKKYPEKEYLVYLGKKYVDPFTARIADRFEMLYHDETVSETINSDFIDYYNSARNMVLAVYYSNALRKSNYLYDNFLAMCILFITLQSMNYKYLQVDITRDFYDVESLKLVYDSYGVPFYDEIPLEYHRKIVKNINKLISYKGSSTVFFDLFSIFDVGSMDIYSYFLTKTHLFGEDGSPLFNIKKDENGEDIYDEEGNPVLDDSNYKIRFSRVKLADDPALSISDDSNNVDYLQLTGPDPYWIEDEELINKLANENFNYLESKYIGIQTVFNLMKITFENAYIFRLITDKKELTDALEFRWSDMGITCSIFDIFIYLASIYCRYCGYEGIITNKIPAIMDTLGYDFDAVAMTMKSKEYLNDVIQKNTKLINLIESMEITDINSINTTYDKINEIREMITDGYVNAKTIDEFNAYRDLYNSLLISKEVTAVYTDPNTGKVYETFKDVLSATSPLLMQRYLLLDDAELENEIIATTDKIDEMLTSLKYLQLSSGLGQNTMLEPLFKILKFFKSAKAELVDYNVIYILDMKGTNFFKIMDLVYRYQVESKATDSTYLIDILNMVSSNFNRRNELVEMIETVSDLKYKYYLYDQINRLTDELIFTTTVIDRVFNDNVWYIDFLEEAKVQIKFASHLFMTDENEVEMINLDIIEARYKGLIKDEINRLTDSIKINDKLPIIFYITEVLTLLDKIKECTIISRDRSDQLMTDASQKDQVIQTSKGSISEDNLKLVDLLILTASKIKVGSKNKMHDRLKYTNLALDCLSYQWYSDILEKESNSALIKDRLKLLDKIIQDNIVFDTIDPKNIILVKDGTNTFKDYIKDLTKKDTAQYIIRERSIMTELIELIDIKARISGSYITFDDMICEFYHEQIESTLRMKDALEEKGKRDYIDSKNHMNDKIYKAAYNFMKKDTEYFIDKINSELKFALLEFSILRLVDKIKITHRKELIKDYKGIITDALNLLQSDMIYKDSERTIDDVIANYISFKDHEILTMKEYFYEAKDGKLTKIN